jgi:hypothetical protein
MVSNMNLCLTSVCGIARELCFVESDTQSRADHGQRDIAFALRLNLTKQKPIDNALFRTLDANSATACSRVTIAGRGTRVVGY